MSFLANTDVASRQIQEEEVLQRSRRIADIIGTVVLLAFTIYGGINEQTWANNESSELSANTPSVNSDSARLFPKVGVMGRPSMAELDYILSKLDHYEYDYSDQEQEEDENQDAASNGISMENVEYVATLIESEAGNVNSMEGRVSIALTAFKRVESSKYPDTLTDVVEQPYQYADLVGYYSDKSYDAAVRAISLWEEGTDDTVLPDGYLYFFGYKQQNWFYRYKSDGGVEFYTLPGQTITDDVWQAFREIVLNEVPAEEAETEVQDAIGETLDEQAADAAATTTTEDVEAADTSTTATSVSEENDTATEAVSQTEEEAVINAADSTSL